MLESECSALCTPRPRTVGFGLVQLAEDRPADVRTPRFRSGSRPSQ